jgi:hypothetical protein
MHHANLFRGTRYKRQAEPLILQLEIRCSIRELRCAELAERDAYAEATLYFRHAEACPVSSVLPAGLKKRN